MSIPVTPEKTVLEQVVTRLSASSDGLNATFNSLAASMGIAGAVGQLAIDFVSTPSKNFVLGEIDPGDFEQTSVFKYPVIVVFAKRSENQNFQKFTTFSGLVTVGINVFISWRHNNALRDFESYGNAMAGAIYTIFNRSRSGNAADQNWSQEVTYNGGIGLAKSAIQREAENWFQQLAFTLVFEVDQ